MLPTVKGKMEGNNFGRFWTPEEDKILRHYYPREGLKGTIKRLQDKGFERSEWSVQHRAQRKLIYVGDIPGYITIPEMLGSGCTGRNYYYRVLFQACKDGVLLELPNPSTKYMVPQEWADAFMEDKAIPQY